jgi:hypothetical protein
MLKKLFLSLGLTKAVKSKKFLLNSFEKIVYFCRNQRITITTVTHFGSEFDSEVNLVVIDSFLSLIIGFIP